MTTDAAHASPASFRSLATVLMLAPVIRVIARMDIPSTSMARIWVRFDIGSLFIALRLTSDWIWLTILGRKISII